MSWHPPSVEPQGRNHGSAGICITATGEIALVSGDGPGWDFPAGRPERDETWEQTLRREMKEEACVTVLDARMLGFCLSECVAGHEEGLVLVRSYWRAEVQLDEWTPQHEIAHRFVVPASEVASHLLRVFLPISRRALIEAGVNQ